MKRQKQPGQPGRPLAATGHIKHLRFAIRLIEREAIRCKGLADLYRKQGNPAGAARLDERHGELTEAAEGLKRTIEYIGQQRGQASQNKHNVT